MHASLHARYSHLEYAIIRACFRIGCVTVQPDEAGGPLPWMPPGWCLPIPSYRCRLMHTFNGISVAMAFGCKRGAGFRGQGPVGMPPGRCLLTPSCRCRLICTTDNGHAHVEGGVNSACTHALMVQVTGHTTASCMLEVKASTPSDRKMHPAPDPTCILSTSRHSAPIQSWDSHGFRPVIDNCVWHLLSEHRMLWT